MSAFTKVAGVVAGLSTVAIIGVAVAQSEPPNPFVSNPAIGAGQQSTHLTPMGETGVLAELPAVRTATITRQPEVAQVAPAPPAPAPVAEAKPEPEPAPVAAAPAPEPPQSTVAMGAAPEPAPAPVRPKRDRN